MARSFILSSALFALRATAQVGSAFTDDKSGIKFSAYTHATSGSRFGVALPENPTTDFIGQISAPIANGGGWAGMSVASGMVGNLLIVAWPNEGEVVSSFRKATGYTNPPIATGDFTLKTIPDGTYMNDTAFTYTFLCSNCIGDDGMKLVEASQGTNVLGWAFSDDALTDSTSASATLNYHSGGFGAFGMVLDDAKSAEFDTWAALAVSDSGSGGNSTTPGGNSTTPIGGGNSTAPEATIANSTYDYIVAGGGPAGIIAAERLAESGASVLLLERGGTSLASTGNTDTLSWNSSVTMYDVPGLGYYLSQAGKPAFCVDTADQAGCLLGGGTMVNAMMFVKPQSRDFDAKWPEGWKWADVSAAADRVWERNPGQNYGSMDGNRYNNEAYDVLSQFFQGQGWTETDFIKDPNSKVDVFGYPPWNTADGLRSGPVRTYLPLAQQLDNFKLQLNSKVVRAVRNGSAITGVETENEATGERVIYNIKSGGGVVLAAGAMSTPRILFNSGIGPAEQLQTVASGTSGVTLPDEADWIDLPVGAEIKDHMIFTLKFSTSNGMPALSTDAFTSPNQTTIDLFAKGDGILAQSGQRLNFWTSVNTTDGTEVFFQGTCNGPSNNTVQMKVYITHGATSAGSLGITADGATELTKDPWLQTDTDIEAATLMMDRLLKMTSAPNSTIKYISSGANVTGADLIKGGKTGLHYVGTAKMGTKGDVGVVVDNDTKVYGTDNLFVVDASIHPDLPTGNTQAIVMVAAEAAAARILASKGGASNGTTPSLPEESTPVLPEATGVAGPTGTGISSPIGTSVPAVPSGTPPSESAPAQPPQSSRTSPSEGSPTQPSQSSEAATAEPYGRCGGQDYQGPTTCPEGWQCQQQNSWYSQCVQGAAKPAATPAPQTGSYRKRSLRRRSAPVPVARVPISPGAFEDEESVWQRSQMERASYLDTYEF